jgi:hypothetical protein
MGSAGEKIGGSKRQDHTRVPKPCKVRHRACSRISSIIDAFGSYHRGADAFYTGWSNAVFADEHID